MSNDKRHKDAQPINKLMQEFINENNLNKGLSQLRVEEAWASEMGNGVLSYTHKLELKGETLLVFLNSSVLREELQYGKDKIINILNEKMGDDFIKKIRFL